jgi:UDP-N-acetylmuramoyl-tripeptide--D-alanyl-D-alanine ligase
VVRVGLGQANDWRAQAIQPHDGGLTFQCLGPRADFDGEYRLGLLGQHQATNALLVIAMAAELGLRADAVRRGLAACKPPKMRLQVWEANGVRVLDDSYNANADSMRAAPCAGRRVAVLGDMAELGTYTASAHREVGQLAAQMGVARLIAVGHWARETVAAAVASGLRDVHEFSDLLTATRAVRNLVEPGDLVLLKASRSAELDRLGNLLRGEAKQETR